MSIAQLSLQERADLRYRILRFFEDGNYSFGMGGDPVFESYTQDQVSHMRQSMLNAGLITIVNGKSTRGSAYELTEVGRDLMNNYAEEE